MPALVVMAEFISVGLLASAIAWLRHLRGAPRMIHDTEVRYVVPVLTAIIVLLLIGLGVDEQRRGEFHPDSSPRAVAMAFGLGVAFAAMVAWLVVEVRRFRARPHDARPATRPRAHRR